jgi:anti-anti-sigma factor
MPIPRLETQQSVTVVSFDEGPLTLQEASLDELQEPMLNATLAEPPWLVVDLSNVEFFGSSFIELLFRIWKRIQHRAGRFALCGLSPYCQEVLSVTNLDTLWPNYPTREQAVVELSSRPQNGTPSTADAP